MPAAVAEARDPNSTRLGEVVSGDVIRIPHYATTEAADLMREHAVRRLVVTDDSGSVAGVVSIGDLALAGDMSSVLAEISNSPPSA